MERGYRGEFRPRVLVATKRCDCFEPCDRCGDELASTRRVSEGASESRFPACSAGDVRTVGSRGVAMRRIGI
jgi:hypothetical protein